MNQHTSPPTLIATRFAQTKTRFGFKAFGVIVACLISLAPCTLAPRAATGNLIAHNSAPRAVQSRDWLTEDEDMRVREAQEIDKRIDVFIKVIERRLLALTNVPAVTSKQARKDAEMYGELRNGTPTELLGDIVRALNAAVDNIDDASSRTPQKKLLPKALEKLQTATRQHRAQFSALHDQSKDTAARRLLDQSIEISDSILAAQPLVAEPATSSKPKP